MEELSRLNSESREILKEILEKIDLDSTSLIELRILKRKFDQTLKNKEKSKISEKEINDISALASKVSIKNQEVDSIKNMDTEKVKELQNGFEELLQQGVVEDICRKIFSNLVKKNT